MHFMLECPLYSEDKKLLYEKPRIESELVDKDLSMKAPEGASRMKECLRFLLS